MKIRLGNKSATVGKVAVVTFLATGAGASIDEPPIDQLSSGEYASMEPSFTDVFSSSDRPETTIPIQDTKESWDRRDAQRFKSLAVKSSLGMLESDELNEFLFLQTARRRLESPLSGDEILADFKRQQMFDDLLAFFEKHTVNIPKKISDRSRAWT